MTHITRTRAAELISGMGRQRILVVGDLMIDAYIWGKVNRISPEAPIPVVEVQREESKPGGAANVGLNLLALGATVSFAGIVGLDTAADTLRRDLAARGAGVGGIIGSASRPTTIKTRVIAQHQQVVRIDKESAAPLGGEELDRLWQAIKPLVDEADGIILSDYNKGVLQAKLVADIISRAGNKIVTVDPKPQNMHLFRGASLVTPNKKEAEAAVGFPLGDENAVRRAAEKLQADLSLKATLITRGEEGMTLYDGRTLLNIPTHAKKVFDVTGAGDTVIGVATLALCAGATLPEATVLSNIAAGITVSHIGVYAPPAEEILAAIE